MAQLGNTYTGKLADIPTYLTRNHLYYAYDSQQLYAFNPDGSPYLLAPIFGDGSSAESDPIFKAHVVYNITSGDIANWNTAFSWGDHALEGYLKEVTVVDINSAVVKKDIATVDGKIIRETVTKLNEPELVGNKLYIRYLKEDGVEQEVMIDLSSLNLPNDGGGKAITDFYYDNQSNILSIIEDGDTANPWEVDLSEFSVIPVSNQDGSLDIFQEKDVNGDSIFKFKISKVGQSNNYLDLDNRPELDFHTKYEIWQFFEGTGGNPYYINEEGDTIESVVYQPANWNFAWRWTNNFTPLNLNLNPNVRNIASISYGANSSALQLFNIKETITTLSNLRLEDDTWLYLTYTNETGVASDVKVDLATLIPNIDSEIRIQNAAWDETLDQIVLTETDGKQWYITLPEFLREVVVVSKNPANINLEIGTVDGKSLYETLTKLEVVELSDTHILTVQYRGEDGVVQERQIDFSRFLTSVEAEIRITSAYWDTINNTIIIEESDGVKHSVTDFPAFVDYSITATEEVDGSTTVTQPATGTTFTVPKSYVGFNVEDVNHNHMFSVADEEPIRFEGVTFDIEERLISVNNDVLPKGLEGQVYYITEDGTNDIDPDFILHRAIVVENQEEFDVVAATPFQWEEVYRTWEMFSHGYNPNDPNEQSPPVFPAFNVNAGKHENETLTPEEFYAREAWQYDVTNNRVYLTKNYALHTGFYSPRKFGNYTFEATFSAANGDDDTIALVIGFDVDPETGYESTLTVTRQLGDSPTSYAVYYNRGQRADVQKLLLDGTSSAPWAGGSPNLESWEQGNHTRVQVERVGDIFYIKCSQFKSTTIDDSTLLTLDLNDPTLNVGGILDKFKTASNVGFSASSQKNATFSDLVFTGMTDYIFWPHRETNWPYNFTSYDTYEYNFDTQQYQLQEPQTVFAQDHIGKGRFVYSYMFDKTYYINEYDQWIKISGTTHSEVNNIINNGGYLTELPEHNHDDRYVKSVTGEGVDNTDPFNPIISWPEIPTLPENWVETVTGDDVDNTDPKNPIIDSGVMSVTGEGVDNADPKNPVISWPEIPTLVSELVNDVPFLTEADLPEFDQDNKIRMIYLFEDDLPNNYTVDDVAALITSIGLTIGEKEVIAWEVLPGGYVESQYVANQYSQKSQF